MEIILKYFADFTPEQVEQFQLLKPIYQEWNEQINVISRKDFESLYEKHVLHSLSITNAFEPMGIGFADNMEVLDLGTGGGFPGIPLAIFYPNVKFHLVDSIAKKLKVVSAVAEGLGLKNVTTQHTRVEDIQNRKFDFIVSRAVAPLKDLWKWSRPLLKIKTATDYAPGLICLKGGDLAAEIHESGLKPRVIELSSMFEEEYYKEKYILYIPK